MAREALSETLDNFTATQRAQGLLWVPIFLGCGIWIYFALMEEPSLNLVWAVTLFALIGLGVSFRIYATWALFVLALSWSSIGFSLAAYRANDVGDPVLGWRYYGTIEGTVVAIDKSSSDKPRITLANPTMPPISPPRTPNRIRVSLHGGGTVPSPGERIRIKASFSPPNGPSEPHGYNFQRRAWFQNLGAVGYSRNPPEVIKQADLSSWSIWIFDIRVRLSQALRSELPEKEGGFAAAILTGDRAYVDKDSLNHLRRANLAHLLAISGLHMGLMTGVVFAIVRFGCALSPKIGLRFKTKKIAAVFALVAGFSYLILSGASVATERAFIMVAVMFGAILLDRPAISLRAIAIAATLILVFWPENLLEPGFQMSFAATTALVVCFRSITKSKIWRSLGNGRSAFLLPLLSLIGSSLIAGAATAPFAAYHFNQMAHYGLIANVASLPIMGMIIMPAAVIAIVLWPFGLQAVPLWAMGKGIAWILEVAEFVSNLGGAVSQISAAGDFALMFVVVGSLLTILLSRYSKVTGLILMGAGIIMWGQGTRPDVLITANGRMVGILQDEHRILNRKRGNGFAARTWVENDGGVFDQVELASQFVDDSDRFTLSIGDGSLFYLWEKETLLRDLERYCGDYSVVIIPKYEEWYNGKCEFWGKKRLRYDGSLAFSDVEGRLQIETARQVNGRRLWNTYKLRKARGF